MDDSRLNDDSLNGPECSWVSDLLASQNAPSAPDDVVETVLAALGDEQSTRQAAERAKSDSLGELLGRSVTGTFGTNAPTHYTKKGLGLRQSQPHR